MYWPWSLRLARRAGESLSFRPRRPGEAGARDAPSSAGARRPNERTIDPSALRIDRSSLPTDARSGLANGASLSKGRAIVLQAGLTLSRPPEGQTWPHPRPPTHFLFF